ncbi:disease resistance protein RPP2B-like isoform X1 [Carya illinoinensis]|uniref:disease resistance protein RPP2B-like isoform X1 n=1 Tax=Carya illinoinensis TaxID=32201 RepID=UPI001C721362|nr:disease resistance protein RPP2B-like isoform X1 [Carya illinoinensis]
MRDSIIKELGDGFKPKNLKIMTFYGCKFFKKIPDFSSISNLKELIVQYCKRLVEVHDSVGSLKNLSKLDFEGCSKLQILPRSLKLRSLCELNLGSCSSLRDFPEIECKMECLRTLSLYSTAVEELPSSIRNLVGLEELTLWYCKNLMRLPIALIQLQHLRELSIGGCTKLVKKMRDEGQSLDLHNDSTTIEDEISNSSNGSTALQVPNLQISCSHSESNFFTLNSFFTMFNSSATLHKLNLCGLEIVSLPTNIKEFVTLTYLDLRGCLKLKEIAELPPNISHVSVSGCKSLERFSEVSKILEFNGSHIRSLCFIELTSCDKMHVNIWNDEVQNPLLWKGLYDYDATLFPKNHIPDWFNYVHEFLKYNEMVKGLDDDAQPKKKEEWVIDIEGPHYLEEISGIVLYLVIFFKDAWMWNRISGEAKITSNSSNHVCRMQEGVELVNTGLFEAAHKTGYDVWVGYSNLQSFDLKVLDNLRVQFDLHHDYGRIVGFYKSCRAKVLYKNERRSNKKRRTDEINRMSDALKQGHDDSMSDALMQGHDDSMPDALRQGNYHIKRYLSRLIATGKRVMTSQNLLEELDKLTEDKGDSREVLEGLLGYILCSTDQEAAVVPPYVAFATRPNPGFYEFVKVNSEDLSIEAITASEYLRFREVIFDENW